MSARFLFVRFISISPTFRRFRSPRGQNRICGGGELGHVKQMLCCNSGSETLEERRCDAAAGNCSVLNMGRSGAGQDGSLAQMIQGIDVQGNIDYFKNVETETGSKILAHLKCMEKLLHDIEKHVHLILNSAHLFDLDSETRANGFRSIVAVATRFVGLTVKLCDGLRQKRRSPFFRGDSFVKELDVHVNIMRGIEAGLSILKLMLENTENGSLFVGENLTFSDLFEKFDSFNPTSFYGRYMGFYYCDAIRRTLRKGHAVLSAYRDHYYQTGSNFGSTTTLLWRVGKYSMDTELRAKQMVEMRRNVHTDFLKAMWSLNEQAFLKKVNKFISASVQVACDVVVPLDQLKLPKTDEPSTLVEIPIPSSHGPAAPIRCRLISSAVRDGMQSVLPSNLVNSSTILPASRGLVLHFHGGGFIAQSAESHEIYLNDWARQVHAPILSVDYSLAPERPYPRALEEVAFVYAWALNNCHKLGWTGERICLAGDSAGGNLCLVLCLKMIQMGLRLPDALFCAYTPVMLNAHPSPSKVLTCMDPLIPLEFLLTCVHAYVGVDSPGKTQDSGNTSKNNTVTSTVPSVPQPERDMLNEGLRTHESIPPQYLASNDEDPSRDERLPPGGSGSERRDNLHNRDVQCSLSSPHNLEDGSSGEENVTHDVSLDPPDSARWKAAETSEQSVDRAPNTSRRRLPKTRRDELPWFHPDNPDRLSTLEKLVANAGNPLMTPYLAPDDLLSKMPPAYFLCLHLDPTLDDMIMLAKKLRSLGCQVTVKVLDHLPHGFLNLFPRGIEAQDGIQCCVDMLRSALQTETRGGK